MRGGEHEEGWGMPAGDLTARDNTHFIAREMGRNPSPRDYRITNQLREELGRVGLKGFKRGGRVKRTGIYKLHRGERVIPARKSRRR